MKDRDLEQLFNQTNKINSSAEAKLRARNTALAAFDEVHGSEENSNSAQKNTDGTQETAEGSQVAAEGSQKNSGGTQGLAEQPRLTPESTNTDRSNTMNTTFITPTKRWAISSMASAAVVVLAFTMAINFYPELDYAEPNGSPELFSGKTPAKIADIKTASEPPARLEMDSAELSQRTVELEEIVVASKPSQAMQEMPMAISSLSAPATAPGMALKREAGPQFKTQLFDADDRLPTIGYQETGRDRFEAVDSNRIQLVSQEPVSTFSVDVDTAAYTFVRRQLNQGYLPQKDAVRLEEMVNYFDYHYALPNTKAQPFNSNIAVFDSPWNQHNQIVHIGIKGYELAPTAKPKSNLVFLLDVSGSMNSPDKLPLVKQSMSLLLSQLNPDDTVAIAVYAGAAGTVLEPTPVKDKQKIMAALQRLQAGGSTAGAQGIQLAYQLAEANFVKDGINRIILATDGDFNVGITNREELKSFVERKRESNIFLSVLGFGQGNYHDHMMQTLAQNGNGIAAYIDTLSEAQKVLVNEATSTLFPIAKDVKIQVEFNPALVKEYRLLGYETRLLNREDFNNDKVDAGDIGAGHTVTALYEITPVNSQGSSDALRYQQEKTTANKSTSTNELGFVKIRYKLPEQSSSQLINQPIPTLQTQSEISATLKQESQFATAVAGFAQLLKGGQYTGDWDYDDAINLAKANRGEDDYGYRTEFVQLIRKAKTARGM